jgi:predicted amidohydrolase YtcJ
MNMAGDRLGEPRLEASYAWKTLLASGATVAGGSDFPVEPANPFYGLHAAVTRSDREGKPLAGWLPEQKLSRAQALSLFTEQAAFAAFQENLTGRLLPGYAADFIVVRDDYFTVPEQDIWRNQVLETWVGGERVYRRAAEDKRPAVK